MFIRSRYFCYFLWKLCSPFECVYCFSQFSKLHSQFLLTAFSGDQSGRLLRYDPVTKEVKVLYHRLQSPNGITISKDGSFLVFSETAHCRYEHMRGQICCRCHCESAITFFSKLFLIRWHLSLQWSFLSTSWFRNFFFWSGVLLLACEGLEEMLDMLKLDSRVNESKILIFLTKFLVVYPHYRICFFQQFQWVGPHAIHILWVADSLGHFHTAQGMRYVVCTHPPHNMHKWVCPKALEKLMEIWDCWYLVYINPTLGCWYRCFTVREDSLWMRRLRICARSSLCTHTTHIFWK